MQSAEEYEGSASSSHRRTKRQEYLCTHAILSGTLHDTRTPAREQHPTIRETFARTTRMRRVRHAKYTAMSQHVDCMRFEQLRTFHCALPGSLQFGPQEARSVCVAESARYRSAQAVWVMVGSSLSSPVWPAPISRAERRPPREALLQRGNILPHTCGW